MSTGRAQPLILAIGSRDEFLHVFQNDQELLAVNTIGTDPGEYSSPIEFFDSDGHRLAGVYDRQWQLRRLSPTTGKSDLPVLLRRVRNAVDNLQSLVENNPEDSALFGTAVKEGLLQFSRVRTSADLRDYLQAYFPRPGAEQAETGDQAFGIASPADVNGNPFHNARKRVWGH